MKKIHTYLFRLTAFLSFLLTTHPCFSQGMINNGATIIITTGANVYIDGDALGKYTNQTNAGTDGKIDLNGNIYVEGDWINNATGNNVFINNTAAPWGTAYLNGAVASNISGTRLTEFENLYIQNANRTLQVTDCEVNSVLTLNNMGLLLNQKKFIIDNPSNTGITTVANGHVRSESTTAPFGEIQWNIGAATGSNYVIPFATIAPALIPFTFRPVTGITGNIITATYPTNAANMPYPPGVTHLRNYFTGLDNSAMTVDRFWEIVVPGALANSNMNFRCTAAEAAGIPNPRAQRWIPPTFAWEFPLQGAQVTAATGTDVTGISGPNTWWTLADITSPLPVELVSFDAGCIDNKIELKWSTASEINNNYFTVEKSRDGIYFEALLKIEGAGTSASPHSYSAFDLHPFEGNSYYRLKQTDYNGTVAEISKIINSKNCFDKNKLSASLINNNGMLQLLINAPDEEIFNLQILDISGRLIYSNAVEVKEGYNKTELFTYLPAGVHLLRLQGTIHFLSQKIILY